jgi:xylan 1,4-beta-xylosidase
MPAPNLKMHSPSVRFHTARLAVAWVFACLCGLCRATAFEGDAAAGWKYQNPIIGGFHPDPSVCRVGDDFYLVNSSFEYFPGVPIFHSRDLGHWEQIGHVLTRPSQLNLQGVKASEGIYAPTLRYHDGLYYVITTLVGQGPHRNFFVTAQDPGGPWSDPVVLENAPGIDPSLFLDDDGRAYYTGNRRPESVPADSKFRQIWLQELDLKQQHLVGDISVLVEEGALHGANNAEGAHVYKHGGYYYAMIAEGGTGDNHAVTIFRSRNLRGPYEGNKKNPILTHRHLGHSFPIACTGHADLVETAGGEWWMVLLAVRPYGQFDYNLGRETFLAQVTWEDGWPVVNPGKGMVEFSAAGPRLTEQKFPAPAPRTEFDAPTLGFEWNFLRTPAAPFWSLTEHPGWLRLHLQPATLAERATPAFVGRRITDPTFAASAAMHFLPARDGESAGIVVEQSNDFHFRVEVLRERGQALLRLTQRRAGVETALAEAPAPPANVKLRVSAREPSTYAFAYAGADDQWHELKSGVDARVLSRRTTGGFTGAYVGLYASGNGASSTNSADFDWFEYRPAPPHESP